MGELILIRHGETAWSRSGQHAGRTDLPLTDAGVSAATALAPALAHRDLIAAFSSPLRRALHTAELAGLTDVEPDPDLIEWDYGGYEGLTQEQMQRILAARWLGLDPSAGRLFGHPHPGTFSALGTEQDQAVVSTWNVP